MMTEVAKLGYVLLKPIKRSPIGRPATSIDVN